VGRRSRFKFKNNGHQDITNRVTFFANGGKPDRRRKLEMATLIFPQRKNNTGLLNYRIGRKKIMIDRKKQGLSEKISYDGVNKHFAQK